MSSCVLLRHYVTVDRTDIRGESVAPAPSERSRIIRVPEAQGKEAEVREVTPATSICIVRHSEKFSRPVNKYANAFDWVPGVQHRSPRPESEPIDHKMPVGGSQFASVQTHDLARQLLGYRSWVVENVGQCDEPWNGQRWVSSEWSSFRDGYHGTIIIP